MPTDRVPPSSKTKCRRSDSVAARPNNDGQITTDGSARSSRFLLVPRTRLNRHVGVFRVPVVQELAVLLERFQGGLEQVVLSRDSPRERGSDVSHGRFRLFQPSSDWSRCGRPVAGVPCSGSSGWPQLILEATFNAFATEWVFCLSQNNRVDDFVTGNLGSQKCYPFWKLKLHVGEFHEPVTRNRLRPLILHVRAYNSGPRRRTPKGDECC